MTRSAGLALYLASRAFADRGKGKTDQEESPLAARPEGQLVWFASGAGTRPDSLVELARRFVSTRAGSSALVTSVERRALPDPLLSDRMPEDMPRDLKRFLDHWRPDVAVLAGEVAHPAAIVEAHHRGTPVCLLDARVSNASARKFRWAPMATASLFQRVSYILTPTAADAEMFRRLRAPADRVEATGCLEEGRAPLPCNRSDHSALATLLAARPVWLATNVHAEEVEQVLAANDQARRLAHRLLLILSPADPADGPGLRDRFENLGLKVALRSGGEEPDPDVQIYVADVPGEDGLWYRLAPIAFLGDSLIRNGRGHDPHEPAALGSAIVTGRQTGQHREAFSRFLAAGAARTVGSGEALGDAVTDLLSPDRAAEMARRAWEITSAGAEVTDRALEVIAIALDERDPA